MATGYCMKCRKKIEMRKPKLVTFRNKTLAVTGVCPNCGTKVFRIGRG